MAQNYYFSPTTKGFYPVALKSAYVAAGSFPTDAVLVEDSVFATYSANPPSGMKRGADGNAPAWVTST